MKHFSSENRKKFAVGASLNVFPRTKKPKFNEFGDFKELTRFIYSYGYKFRLTHRNPNSSGVIVTPNGDVRKVRRGDIVVLEFSHDGSGPALRVLPSARLLGTLYENAYVE